MPGDLTQECPIYSHRPAKYPEKGFSEGWELCLGLRPLDISPIHVNLSAAVILDQVVFRQQSAVGKSTPVGKSMPIANGQP